MQTRLRNGQIADVSPSDFSRPMSPAILEHRIQKLDQELRFVCRDRDKLEVKNQILKNRIRGFEKMSAALSAKVDEMDLAFKALAGSTPGQLAVGSGGRQEAVDRGAAEMPSPDLVDYSL